MIRWKILADSGRAAAYTDAVKRKVQAIAALGLTHFKKLYRFGDVDVIVTYAEGFGQIVARDRREGLAVWLLAAPTASVVSVFVDPATGYEITETRRSGPMAYTKSGTAIAYNSLTTTRRSGATIIDVVTAFDQQQTSGAALPGGLPKIYRRQIERPTIANAGTQYLHRDRASSTLAFDLSASAVMGWTAQVARRNGVNVIRRQWNSSATSRHDELLIGSTTIYRVDQTLASGTVKGIASFLSPGAGWSGLDPASTLGVIDSFYLLPDSVLLLSTYESASEGAAGRVQRHVAAWYGYDGALIGSRSFDATISFGLSAAVHVAHDGQSISTTVRAFADAAATNAVRFSMDLSSHAGASSSAVSLRSGVTWLDGTTYEVTGGSGGASSESFGNANEVFRDVVDATGQWSMSIQGGASANLATGEAALSGLRALRWAGKTYALSLVGVSGTPTRLAVLSSSGLQYLAIAALSGLLSAFVSSATNLVVRIANGAFLAFSDTAASLLADHSGAARNQVWCASPLGPFVLTESGLFLAQAVLFNPTEVNALIAAAGQANVILQWVGGTDAQNFSLQAGFKTGSRGVWEVGAANGVAYERLVVDAVNVVSSAMGPDSMPAYLDRRFMDGSADFAGSAWK